MHQQVEAYECEWKATLDDPERLKRFVTFVNAPGEPDPTIVFVRERGQIRPATAEERVTAELAGAAR
jgi:nitrite reductase (NADH) large subunit